jgi:hypothetical protein
MGTAPDHIRAASRHRDRSNPAHPDWTRRTERSISSTVMPFPTLRVQSRPAGLPDLNRSRALLDDIHPVTEDDMLFRTAASALILTTSLGLAACGAADRQDHDADDVRATTVAYFHELLGTDPTAACARLTADARREITARTEYSCEAAVRLFHDLATPAQRAAATGIRIHRITFADDHRKAIIADEDVTLPADLEKDSNGRPTVLVKQRDGRWLIQDLGS